MEEVRLKRTGFTLIELMVVIAIIGVLVGLLLPALSSTRESARRTQCMNNLHQLGIGLLAYHEKKGEFPMAAEWPKTNDIRLMYESADIGANWAIRILPEIEQATVYRQFDLNFPIADAKNAAARGTQISVLRCPSDLEVEPFEGMLAAEDKAPYMGANWARGNYAANAGNGPLSGDGKKAPPLDGPRSIGWADVKRRGVMGPNVTTTIKEIEDGTSKTMLLGEVRVGINRRDRRGVWALGQAGSSALYWHAWSAGSVGPANGPNDRSESSDDIPGCLDTILEAGGGPGVSLLASEGMTCRFSQGTGGQAGARSRHLGGVFVAMVDASVRFISDDIEKTEQCCGPWDRLVASRDGLLASEL